MTSWWQLIPTMGFAVGFLLVPGFVIALAWRLRPLMAVAVAAALSFLSIDLSVLVAHAVSSRWNWLWPLAVAAVLAAAGVWRWMGPRHAEARSGWLWRAKHAVPVLIAYLMGLAVAIVTLGRRIVGAMGGPEAIAQRWDNAFHLYASAYIENTGEASPFDVGGLLGTGIYPASFHDAVALVAQTSGVSIPASTQAVMLIAIFAIWPLGLIPLLEALVPMGVIGRLFMGPAAFGLVVFPLGLLDWGMVYPNILALCLTAPVLAVVLRIFSRGTATMLSWGEATGLFVPMLLALGMAHPNAVFLVFAAVIPVLVAAVVRLFRVSPSIPDNAHRKSLGWIALVVLILGGAAWAKQSLALGDDFEPNESVLQALWEIVRGSSVMLDPTPVGYLVVVGLVWALWRFRYRWWLLSGALIVFALYVIAASMKNIPLRHLLTGVLYGDPNRIGAYTAIFSVPLVVAGVQWISRGVVRLLSTLGMAAPVFRWRWMAWVMALVISALASSLVVRSATFVSRIARIDTAYEMVRGNQLISPDELQIMHELEHITSPNDVVVVNPWQGGGLTYVYAQRAVSYIYVFAPKSDDVETINTRLRDAATDPEVCSAIERMGATYVLTLDSTTLGLLDVSAAYAGMSDLEDAPGFEPVLQVGDDVAYKITACQ